MRLLGRAIDKVSSILGAQFLNNMVTSLVLEDMLLASEPVRSVRILDHWPNVYFTTPLS